MRWVHITELVDPTPWLKGGELLLTTGIQLDGAKAQRELIERLVEHEIAGSGLRHGLRPQAAAGRARERRAQARVPAVRGPLRAAVHRDHRARVRAAGRRTLRDAAAQHGRRRARRGADGHLYPEELQARLRPFGIGEQAAVLAFAVADPAAAAPLLERVLAREQVQQPGRDPRRPAVRGDRRRRRRARPARARRTRPRRAGGALRRGARRREPPRGDALAAAELPRGALRAGGRAAAATGTPRRSPRTATSAPSSCCCRCRTTTR